MVSGTNFHAHHLQAVCFILLRIYPAPLTKKLTKLQHLLLALRGVQINCTVAILIFLSLLRVIL